MVQISDMLTLHIEAVVTLIKRESGCAESKTSNGLLGLSFSMSEPLSLTSFLSSKSNIIKPDFAWPHFYYIYFVNVLDKEEFYPSYHKTKISIRY